MTECVTYITPRNYDLLGGVIGLSGTDIRIDCQRVSFEPSTEPVEVTHPQYADHTGASATVIANDPPSYIGSGVVSGPISFTGEYVGPDHAGCIKAMETGVALDIELQLDTGLSYSGELLIVSAPVRFKKDDNRIAISVTGIFSGRITGEGSGDSRAQALYMHLKRGSSYTQGTQSILHNSADVAFVATGFANSNLSIKDAIEAVITKAGGRDSAYEDDDRLKLLSGTGAWQGNSRDTLRGFLHYGLGPLDACKHGIRTTTGWVDEKRRQPVAVSSGENSQVCDDVSGFGASISAYVKKRSPYRRYLIPCVWDAEPDDETYRDTINNNTFTINGDAKAAFTVRWDGVEYDEVKQQDGTSKWVGHIIVSVKKGGWTENRITCQRAVALPPEGGGLFGSVIQVFGWLQVYKYAASAFPTLATFCPNCADDYS